MTLLKQAERIGDGRLNPDPTSRLSDERSCGCNPTKTPPSTS
jgi:hypothetical protein